MARRSIFSVLMLAVLLGVASLVVDGGNALLQRRNQQGVADAAAMAAVKDLPASTSAADTAARTYATTQNSADAIDRRPGRRHGHQQRLVRRRIRQS